MNAKRQTIWLVSMLSLMVVLSAYYLFTEDVSKLDLTALDSEQKGQEVKIDLSQKDQPVAAADAGQAGATDKAAGGKAKSDTKQQTAANGAAKLEAQKNAAADAKVLEQQSKAVSGSDYFISEGLKRHEELRKKVEQLMETSLNNKNKPEVVAQATNELERISEMQEKIEALEEVLIKDFNKALITQEGNKWKVTVQSSKLEKSQGVTIVDLVMKELDAQPENIKIQYVRP